MDFKTPPAEIFHPTPRLRLAYVFNHLPQKVIPMIKSISLPDALQNLSAKGYHLADSQTMDMPNPSIQSNDWRLDSVQQVRPEEQNGAPSLVVIAVSSVHHHLKLVFVEVMQHKIEFSPMNLLRKLFPIFQK